MVTSKPLVLVHMRRLRALLPWLRCGLAAVLALLLVLDLAFPLPLPGRRDLSTVVVARDGTPLRAFADGNGVWRYPATPEQVSPLYLQALLGYEDRWFWYHPGINPVAMLRASAQLVAGRRIVSGGSIPSASSTVGTMSMAWANWVRSSPLALMPFGHETMNGSETPPR